MEKAKKQESPNSKKPSRESNNSTKSISNSHENHKPKSPRRKESDEDSIKEAKKTQSKGSIHSEPTQLKSPRIKESPRSIEDHKGPKFPNTKGTKSSEENTTKAPKKRSNSEGPPKTNHDLPKKPKKTSDTNKHKKSKEIHENEVKTFPPNTVFMNIYNSSPSPPTSLQKRELQEESCAFCNQKATGINHVVKANFNSIAKERPVRLIRGCQACNKNLGELKTIREVRVLETGKKCKQVPMFVMDIKDLRA